MMTTTKNTAATILRQLGNRCLVMIGAKAILDCGDAVQFKVGRNAKGVTHVRITLDPSDTYTVKFDRVTRRGMNVTPKGEVSFVYADQLRTAIETHTGLYTSL